MLTIEQIKRAVTTVGKKYGIKNACLFGSYAKGNATEKSDVDLLIDLGVGGKLILPSLGKDFFSSVGTRRPCVQGVFMALEHGGVQVCSRLCCVHYRLNTGVK